MDHCIQPAAFQPFRQLRRRHDIGELALGQITPFASVPEYIANGHVAAACIGQRGHDVRSDKTGAPCHQQHSLPCRDCSVRAFASAWPARQLEPSALKDRLYPGARSRYRQHCPSEQSQAMNLSSGKVLRLAGADDTRPILIVPYMWIGDFVRGHTVVRVLKERWPNRPVDMLASSLCAPLVDYMPGVRAGIVCDLPRGRLAVARQWRLARRLNAQNYGTAIVLPRTWKSAV